MGGINSGRRNGKACTDEQRFVDVRRFHRDGLLTPDNTFIWSWLRNDEKVASIWVSVGNDCVEFNYRQRWRGGLWRDCANTVRIVWTECHYGGVRPWWQCPECTRSVALLYSGHGRYACRHCRQLAYRSQRETQEDLAARRANRARDQLGWKRGIFNMPGGKPKGMHWKTYFRLVAAHTKHSSQALAAIGRTLGLIQKNLESLK